MTRQTITLLTLLTLTFVGCSQSYYPDPKPQDAEVVKIRQVLAAGDGAGTANTEAAGTGWATIKGKITLTAAPPTAGELTCNKDNATCCKEKLIDNSLVVGPGNGVANVYVYLKTKKAYRIHEQYNAEKGKTVVLDNVKCMFKPHVVAVWTEQVFKLNNADDVGHNTDLTGRFNISLTPNGEVTPPAFKKPDAKPSAAGCSVHPWMKGYVFVADHPYFAISNDKGEFEIKNVPAGENLDIIVWHEKNGALTLNAGGVALNKGVIKLKLAENQTQDVNLAFEPTAFSGQ